MFNLEIRIAAAMTEQQARALALHLSECATSASEVCENLEDLLVEDSQVDYELVEV